MAADIYKTHQFLSNIDSKALWQRRGYRVLLLSEKQLENSQEVSIDFAPGVELEFTLRIRPISRGHAPVSGKIIEKRIPQDQMIEKLRMNASHYGFTLLGAFASDEAPYTLRKPQNTIQLYSMYFVGKLKVINTDQFRSTLRLGIGRSKRFGFGLLNVWN
jgi:hypothetical protein